MHDCVSVCLHVCICVGVYVHMFACVAGVNVFMCACVYDCTRVASYACMLVCL